MARRPKNPGDPRSPESLTTAEIWELLKKKSKSKYKAIKTTVDGIRFDSKREAQRYGQLRLQELTGQIKNLELQPEYKIVINGMHVCTYRGDFRYSDGRGLVVEDAKGVRTPDYKIKAKLMLAAFGIKIVEV